jgi:hypothetical protein
MKQQFMHQKHDLILNSTQILLPARTNKVNAKCLNKKKTVSPFFTNAYLTSCQFAHDAVVVWVDYSRNVTTHVHAQGRLKAVGGRCVPNFHHDEASVSDLRKSNNDTSQLHTLLVFLRPSSGTYLLRSC